MVNLVEKSLHVGKTDSYSLTVNTTWLNGEAILTANVTSDIADVTVGDVSIVGNVIYAYLTGVSAKAYTDVHFDYTTATRSDCDTIRVKLEAC